MNKSCLTVTDPVDSSNQIRTCFFVKRDKCGKNACFCTEDACNGAGGAGGELGWPAGALMAAAVRLTGLLSTVAALAAALVGGS